MIKINGEKFVCTGSSGFIGSHIVETLLEHGKDVVGIDIKPPAIHGYRHIYHDISLPMQYDFKADTIFHEACSKCTVCREDPFKDLMVNALGTFHMADLARRVGAKIVHASTGSVYGDGPQWYPYLVKKDKLPSIDEMMYELNRNDGFIQCCGEQSVITSQGQHEDQQYAPKSFYGVSKLAGEQYLRAFKEYYGLRFVALRYFHVYGPRQDAGPSGGVVPIFITKMLNGEPITIFGDGEQTRSFTYVKDVVRANFLAANSTEMEGEYFNVASGVEVSLNQLIEILEDIMKVKAKKEYVAPKPGDIKYFNVSNNKIGRHGMDDWTVLEDGLKQTVEWYRERA